MINSLYARLGIGAVLLLAGAALGWMLNGWRLHGDAAQATAALSQQVAIVAQAREQQAAQAARQLATAQAAADQAVAQAQARADQAQRRSDQLQQEISHVTSATRPCLSAAARGLLDSLPAFSGASPGLRVSAPAGSAPGPATASATPAGGSAAGQSSERAVAHWIDAAARLYDTCRGSIDALRAWAQSIPQNPLQMPLLAASAPRQ